MQYRKKKICLASGYDVEVRFEPGYDGPRVAVAFFDGKDEMTVRRLTLDQAKEFGQFLLDMDAVVQVS